MPDLVVDESFLLNGSQQPPTTFGTVANGVVPVTLNVPGGQQSLTFVLSASGDSGLIDSATGQHVILSTNAAGTLVTGKTEVGGDTVFTISVNAAGEIVLTDVRGVHELTPGDPNEGISLASGLVTLTVTVTDNSNQQTTATVDVGSHLTFLDDGPLNNSETVSIAVAEDTLAAIAGHQSAGNPDSGSSLTTTAFFTGAQLAGLVIPGADAPVTIGFNSDISGNTGLTQTTLFNGVGTTHDIVWATNGAHEVDGVVSGGPNDGDVAFKIVQTAGVDTIFGTADDVFTFTLLEHVDNGTGDSNTIDLSLAGVFKATDADGDPVIIDAGATVSIQNDVPETTVRRSRLRLRKTRWRRSPGISRRATRIRDRR